MARYRSTSFTESFVPSETEPFVPSEAESLVASDFLLVDFVSHAVLFVFEPAMARQQNKLMQLIKAYELFP
jgi:hypothetical protein